MDVIVFLGQTYLFRLIELIDQRMIAHLVETFHPLLATGSDEIAYVGCFSSGEVSTHGNTTFGAKFDEDNFTARVHTGGEGHIIGTSMMSIQRLLNRSADILFLLRREMIFLLFGITDHIA